MNFLTHNDKNICAVGSCFQGYISAEYFELKRIFGKALSGDMRKIDAYWKIEFPDGTIATIYNYKDGRKYLGKHGTPKSRINIWHVGGFSETAVTLIKSVLNK